MTLIYIHLKDFAALCAEENGKRIIFDLPSAAEKKGFSIAMTAILDNNRIKSIGFEPGYEMKDAIHRTIEIIK